MIGRVIRTGEVWPRETAKNRKMIKVMKKMWEDLNKLKGSTVIEIRDKGDHSHLIEDQIEKYLNTSASLTNQVQERARISTFINNGVLGNEEREYEIKKEGKIRYIKTHTIGAFVADITLIGFDKRTKIYKKLEKDLSEVVNLKPNNLDYFLTDFHGIGKEFKNLKDKEQLEKMIKSHYIKN